MRLAAFVSPKSRPKIHATRSNSATATSPQLSPPTISKVVASKSIRSILSLLCPGFVQTLARPTRLCQIFVQILYSGVMADAGHLRIGELSRRTGTSVDSLRAWERRYGLLSPDRSDGGFRLYSDEDVERVRAMQAHLHNGLAAAEAARRALETGFREAGGSDDLVTQSRRELVDALASFAEGKANSALDRLLGALSVDTLLVEIVLPYLHELGEAWARGNASVAQEHVASNFIRGRLFGLARGWGEGAGPHALLACPPGEQHDLGLIAFGLTLRNRGWRITYLGQDTPLSTLEQEARELAPDRVVVAASTP